MFHRRIVVTGLGIISPVGNDVETAWAAIRQGKSGIDRIQGWDVTDFHTQIGGQVKDFDPVVLFGRREARRMDPMTQWALAATGQALADSELNITDDNRERIAVLIGTGSNGLTATTEGVVAFHERGPRGVSPVLTPMMMPDGPAAKVSIDYGLQGPNMQLASACATGNNSIGEAAHWIDRGLVDVAVAGATEGGFVPFGLASFDNLKALSRRNDEPQKASRPFDAERDGFVMSQGAGVLILEALDHAVARGARIYGELTGYGLTSDAYHMTAPDETGRGAARAINMALNDAQITVDDIDYINAHGTSTPFNDRSETLAVKAVFGETAYTVPMSSTKSMTGHLMSASGAVEAIFSLKAIEDQFIPPTINLENPDPDCDLDYVPNIGREKAIDVVMSNAFGFGGHNVVLILRKYHGES